MTADQTHSPTCVVCRRRLAAGESYLVRLRHGEPVAVHQHLCFPPPRKRDVAVGTRAA
jgi:hypothetical protein